MRPGPSRAKVPVLAGSHSFPKTFGKNSWSPSFPAPHGCLLLWLTDNVHLLGPQCCISLFLSFLILHPSHSTSPSSASKDLCGSTELQRIQGNLPVLRSAGRNLNSLLCNFIFSYWVLGIRCGRLGEVGSLLCLLHLLSVKPVLWI